MKNRPRRVLGKSIPGARHYLVLVVAVMLVAVAAGYVLVQPGKYFNNGAGTGQASTPCDPICMAGQSAENDSQKSAYAEEFESAMDNSSVSGSSRARAGSMFPESSQEFRIDSNQLRPRYTLVELCALVQDEFRRRWQCDAGDSYEVITQSATDQAKQSAERYSIGGHVLSADGRGLGGITLVATPERLRNQLLLTAGSLRFHTQTDSLGAYNFDGLPSGEYTIQSRALGPFPSARIAARAGVDYADLVLPERSTIVFKGQVLAATGEPLEGVTVLPTFVGQASVLSNDYGRFRLPVFLPSEIREVALRFQSPGFQEQIARVDLQQLQLADVSDLTVILQPVETWTSLRGTLRSTTGEVLAGRAIEIGTQASRIKHQATTDSDGRFEFPIVESPADYRVVAFGGAGYRDHQQTLHLTADTRELAIVVEPYEFGRVTGQVVNADGLPVPDFDLVLRNRDSRRPNTTVSTDQGGNFEVLGVPAGELVVASQSTPSILVQGLLLQPGDSLHVPLVLDWGEHELRGIVVDAQGNPVPASRVLLQWVHQSGVITTQASRRTATDTQGQFAFSKLGPGPHSLQVDAKGFSPVNIDHDLSRQGYALTVKLNGTLSTRRELPSWPRG